MHETRDACDACVAASASAISDWTVQLKEQPRVGATLAAAHAVKPWDRMAEAFAVQAFGRDFPVTALTRQTPRKDRSLDADALAIMVPVASGLIDRQIIKICRHFVQEALDIKIVVFGRCVNDLAVMAPGNAFVTGEIKADEYSRLIVQYGVCALMSPYRTCLFGLMDDVAGNAGLPKAYFDWSFGALPTEDGDLALDPRICDERAAAAIAGWLQATAYFSLAQ